MKKFLSKIINYIGIGVHNILVVDDVEENVELLENYLDTLRWVRVYKSYDGFGAEKLLKKIDFSLIILDIQMPKMDGYELATKIKSNKYNRNKLTEIIFVTGIYNSEIDKMKGYNIGSIDYILKPIEYDIFIEKVKNYISKMDDGDNKYFLNQRMDNIKKSIDM